MFGVPSTLSAMTKVWTYTVSRANPNFEWHLDQLLTPKGVELFEKMIANVKTLLSLEHISNLLDKLSDPKSISSQEFKEKSNCGKVWMLQSMIMPVLYEYSRYVLVCATQRLLKDNEASLQRCISGAYLVQSFFSLDMS